MPLDARGAAELEAFFKARGAKGFRVLAVATRAVRGQGRTTRRDDERGMAFRGFLVFPDPPKAGRRADDPRPRAARHHASR